MEPELKPAANAPHEVRRHFHLNALSWWLMLVLAVAIAATYGRVATAAFVELDDGRDAFRQPNIMGGLTPGNIRWACTTRNAGYWIPCTWLSLQLDATLSEPPLEVPPGPTTPLSSAMIFHIHNVILHIIGSSLLFLFLFRATGRRWPSFFVALLWSLHPLRVESVAWVTERKDVLSGVFGFLAMYWYVVWRERRHWLWGAAVFCAMAASLMAKPTLVTLPCAFILLDCWPLGIVRDARGLLRSALQKWPLFLMAILDSVGTALAQRRVGWIDMQPLERLSHGLISYVRYLWMQVDFRGFAPHHPYIDSPAMLACGALILLAAVTAACLWQRKVRPWLLFGWLWFLGVLFPVVGFLNSGAQDYAERFAYFPSIGLFVMAAFSIPPRWCADRAPRMALLGGVTALGAILAAFTFHQAGYWRDSITLFEHTTQVTPPNSKANTLLAYSYLRARRFDDAVAALKQATDFDPRNPSPEALIALAYVLKGDSESAIPYARKAIVIQPQSLEARQILGTALSAIGRFDEAVEQFAAATQLAPGDPLAAQQLNAARERRPTR